MFYWSPAWLRFWSLPVPLDRRLARDRADPMSGWSSAPPVLLVSKAKAAAEALAGGGSRRDARPLVASSAEPAGLARRGC